MTTSTHYVGDDCPGQHDRWSRQAWKVAAESDGKIPYPDEVPGADLSGSGPRQRKDGDGNPIDPSRLDQWGNVVR